MQLVYSERDCRWILCYLYGNVKKMDGEVCHEPTSVVFGRLNVQLRSGDGCSNVDGEEGVFQDPIPEVVSVRPEVAEKWMDRFVVDLVESPSVFRKSAVAQTFGPAVSEEYSPIVFTGGPCLRSIPLLFLLGGGGGCRCIPPGGHRVGLSSGV